MKSIDYNINVNLNKKDKTYSVGTKEHNSMGNFFRHAKPGLQLPKGKVKCRKLNG